MFDMTVSEAADKLGVSRPRVLQLIKTGALDAEKLGSLWLIDRMSVQSRLGSKPKAGRPPRHSNSTDSRFMLMNREHEVLSFRFDSSTGEFFDADEIIDPARAPLSVMSPRGTNVSKEALAQWWRHRTIPRTRSGIEEKLAELGIAQTYDLPFRSMGLSLSDQYWIRPYKSSLTWSEVNFFDNPFKEANAETWLANVGLDSPDNTSDGILSKKWISREGSYYLLKGGTLLEQEPFNEAIASELCSRIANQDDFVRYEVEALGNSWVSSCPCFLKSDEEFIPAIYVNKVLREQPHRNSYQHYLECCAALGINNIETALSKMIVCDFIMANTDRHWRNFGLIRNVETLEYRPAPIFDTGASLWCNIPTRELEHTAFAFFSKPFSENPVRQLRLVDDDSWLELNTLEGFSEWSCEMLEKNPSMLGRIDFVFEGMQKNIDRVRAFFG